MERQWKTQDTDRGKAVKHNRRRLWNVNERQWKSSERPVERQWKIQYKDSGNAVEDTRQRQCRYLSSKHAVWFPLCQSTPFFEPEYPDGQTAMKGTVLENPDRPQ